jgi:hypothetical protein
MELLLYIIWHACMMCHRCPRLTRLVSIGILLQRLVRVVQRRDRRRTARKTVVQVQLLRRRCTVQGRTAPTTAEPHTRGHGSTAATARGDDLAVVACHDRRERTARLRSRGGVPPPPFRLLLRCQYN